MGIRRLAIVPARGGSKRLVGKNLLMLAGRALINHTVATAQACFDHVIVTSDSPAILAAVDDYPNVVSEMRPAHLATDSSKAIDTVIHVFDANEGYGYDQVWLCLPTCPLRTAQDVCDAQKELVREIDGVVSITDYEFPPSLGLVVSNGLLGGHDPTHPLARGDSRSQDQPAVFRPNGAFYGMWWDSFRKHRNFFRGHIKGCYMPRERSVDIDHEIDLLLAESILALSH